ncbi:hypothetical protein, partial [Nitrosomonas communis]|uniref:hypothetical protein n=1 Tax=Nitrosomonas communis TaxID=44574 RepID=UPI001C436713
MTQSLNEQLWGSGTVRVAWFPDPHSDRPSFVSFHGSVGYLATSGGEVSSRLCLWPKKGLIAYLFTVLSWQSVLVNPYSLILLEHR